MQRYAAGVEFFGGAYHGWQWQKGQLSVQQVVEVAISQVANHAVRVFTAGRTDAGVHSTGLVIHFESNSARSIDAWVNGINRYLPKDVAISFVQAVSKDFHARYSALSRQYRYVIFNRAVPPAHLANRVSWYRKPLKLEPMQQGASYLLGEHNFSAFRAASCQAKNPIKHVSLLTLEQNQNWFWMDIVANGFLHHMVRNIMGVLMEVGAELREPCWVKEVLASRDRGKAAKTASAEGLYFVSVRYPDEFAIQKPIPACRFW